MLSRFRREIAAVELYGKLPIAKDYLRVGGGEESGLALRAWLDHGFSPTSDAEHRPLLAWPGRFMLGALGGDPVMGCCWPSSDSGGLRPFPFTAFISRRRKPLLSAWQGGAADLRPLWEQLVGVFTAHRSYGDGGSFLASMRGQSIAVPKPSGAPPQRVDFDLWVSAAFPDGGQDHLVDILVALKALSTPVGPIRLPLVAGLPAVPQVHAWWVALTELGLCPRDQAPSVFFPLQGEGHASPHFATFFTGPLHPTQQPWLAPREASLGPGDHAPQEVRVVEDFAPVSEATPPLAESMRGPLISARARASG